MESFDGPRAGRPCVVLAPMEGVTDAPMRALQTHSGAFSFCVSEFLRISQSDLPARVFYSHLPELSAGCRTPSGTPVQLQLLGGDAERLARMAALAVGLGVKAIDLNFGCPAPTVNRHDGGATLLKYPHRIREIVSAVRAACPASVPVSAKLRLGWESTTPIFENAVQAAEGGASWITIHGRTRMAGYAPPIHWEPIGKVRALLHPLPVVANGDIWTLDDFRRCRDITGCEHYMLGRGALVDPNLASNVCAELGLLSSSGNPFGKRPEDWLVLFERFGEFTGRQPADSLRVARRIKQWSGMVHRFGGLQWFDTIKQLPDFDAIREALRGSAC